MRAAWSIGAVCALGFGAAASCTTLLGNDFVITGGTGAGGGAGPGVGGTGAANNGGAGGSGAMGSGGGGGGGMGGSGPGPLTCTWTDLEQVESLEAEPAGFQHYGGGRMHTMLADNAVRWAAPRPASSGDPILSVYTATEDNVHIAPYVGVGTHGFVPLDGSSTGLIAEINTAGAPGRALKMLVLDNNNDQGNGAPEYPLLSVVGAVQHLEATAVGPGDGTAVLLHSSRVQGAPYEAFLSRWDLSTTTLSTPVRFDDSTDNPTFTSGDYEVAAFARSGTDNHIVLGAPFDGATRVRQFVVPDSVSGEVAPVRNDPALVTAPFLIGIRKRADDNFSIAYVNIGTSADLFFQVLPGTDLATYDETTFPLIATLPSSAVPTNTEPQQTDDSFLLIGTFDTMDDGLQVTIVHRVSGVRFQSYLPFPSGLPTNYTIGRLRPVVVSPLIDTGLGADIFIPFYLTDDDLGHDEMWLGRMSCSG